ncbi:MAG: leucine--tRNA ligase [Trueperaceae bacterium]|nr:leucine--tRNA ligase [Trueperaceae bacterium]MCC6310178.1 leucine--tRNA ligase [Trueperaceae bacterium]MCO5175100.1 leucine--tRNA ligase [Trueperaceae bacterium]MCW5819296.1 leucine--tRNA ligase [Trueperaceae bacterium]
MTDTITSATGHAERYSPDAIEKKWQQRWREQGIYEVDLQDASRPNYYFLTMYPYPSGDLHIGHWYAETPADAAARYLRMRGNNVLFPMGFDAFGLPAENAAVKAARAGDTSVHPARLTATRMARMREQFEQMGAMFDWSKSLATCDPEYYKWNQWFFIKMLEQDLAYRKESFVNWDPVDQTVLANEQVIDGRGDRSGALIERRLMPQWHFRITRYADELLDFSSLDWPERVVSMQTNWIGRSEGAEVTFKTETGDDIVVFTTRPDTLWGATFMVLAPEHPLVEKLVSEERRDAVRAYVEQASHRTDLDRMADTKEKSGEFLGAYAVNPVNGARIPVWIADYVLMGYGTGAIMAVPYGDQRDFEFARAFGLEIVPVVRPDGVDGAVNAAELTEAWAGPGVMVNSGPLDGLAHNGEKGRASPAIAAAIEYLESNGLGRAQTTYRLRDWLISRQRYWGTPIPVVYCDACGMVPEKLENLPVLLPEDVAFMPTGESPLKTHAAFLETACPSCGGKARRETDTMDTFMDSSWYWFRYLSPHDDARPFDPELAARWTPVDTYTGGIEHAILHLLYARFFTKVLRDMGLTTCDEPFKRLRNQGMILGADNEKMSKSRGNVVNPDDLVARYGADTVRAYLMFLGPWDQGAPWNYSGIEGQARFLARVWNLVVDEAKADAPSAGSEVELNRAINHAVKEVTEDFEAFRFNTAIAELMTLQGALQKGRSAGLAASATWRKGVETLLLLLAPIAPHIAEELWHRLGRTGSVHLQTWPTYDPAALVADTVQMAVQVNGKLRGQVEVAAGADDAAILAAAKADANVAKHVDGKEVVRSIVVRGKLVNFVVK